MSKIGVVIEGGGMRGIYGCGVLDSFLKNEIRFDYSVGVSAGAANLASFVAKQEWRNFRFYTQYAFDERYMGVKNYVKTGSFFGMDFIYSELTNNIDPLDFDTMLSPENEFCIVATDAQNGKAKYFYRDDFLKYREEIFKASSAVPAMCKPINIDGRDYFDGGLADPIPVKRAIADGCDKIVAVLTRPRGFIKKPEPAKHIYKELLKSYPNVYKAMDIRHLVYNSTMEYLMKLEDEGRAMLFCPDNTEGVKLITRNKGSLERLYTEGRNEADERLAELKEFIK